MATLTFKTDLCKGCGLCVGACPKKLLVIAKDKINKKGYHPAEMTDAEKIYKEKIKFYCPSFIFTSGEGEVKLFTKSAVSSFPVKKVEVVSTVGAGDNFNAGVVYGLLQRGIGREALAGLPADVWNGIINNGLDFSAHACTLIENSVDKEWAKNYGK